MIGPERISGIGDFGLRIADLLPCAKSVAFGGTPHSFAEEMVAGAGAVGGVEGLALVGTGAREVVVGMDPARWESPRAEEELSAATELGEDLTGSDFARADWD